uniref:NADH dehydrogenase [ubiquinone] 1 alpha subcomplex assembly factor 2 isoform X1 n=1 Tax=Scatophagus argus TaxID=75038 RepID=UPI001ED7D15D|nr:NADH dehydrogenase [ubiquinone] 1 alpha subcomplex assembly factor 2 isoform X1 [Scatophagus argus]
MKLLVVCDGDLEEGHIFLLRHGSATVCNAQAKQQNCVIRLIHAGMPIVSFTPSLAVRKAKDMLVGLADSGAQAYRRLVRARRMVEAANPREYEYIEGSIPVEWDAWIRGRRKEPPSIEELLRNESYREQIKIKAEEVEGKDLALQAKEYEEGLVATPTRTLTKGHAATTSFGKEEISEDPTSTGNTFQPGSWMPNSKK